MPAARHPVARPACQVCGKPQSRAELLPAALVRAPLAERIRSAFPSWSQDGFICRDDLNRFRTEYVQVLLEDERGELSSLERSVIKSLARHETLAENVDPSSRRSSRSASGWPTTSPTSAAAGPSSRCSAPSS